MTYPPQPGQGGQPDPYGQGWQQPGTGGVPQQPGWDPNAQQQPGQQPGWDPNAQQGGQQQGWDPNTQQQYPGQQPYGQPYQQQYPGTQQYPQQGWDPNQPYGGGYGGGPQPPKNNKTGLWIGIAVAVVVVVALGITGFVAPGFFLSKDSGSTAQTQNQVPPPAQSSRPQLPTGEPSEPGLPTDETDIPGTGGGGNTPAEGKQAVDAFVAKINAKDGAGATAMTCQGSEAFSKDSIDEATTGTPQLKVESYDGTATVTANLDGSLSGKDANGSVIATSVGGNWCIGFFFVIAF
ncbi:MULTISPECIES: hypothetical protein [unclassified Amycolatopsis]|uniref:hypothetical protein n=1 Tax=unclassified Amycolatopsis TaxID=2618356 RepID=UPI001C6A4A5E|nr:hypothetical protein [Amycolatopsis sp. DSM 110486]QYN23846.1 hypothetical protein K1T34_16185 [Amycolatopsis sp. DSM 110486]